MPPLPLTGERTVPGPARERYWFARHEVVYRWLTPRTAGLTVLEAGSGEGYGADLLAQAGAEVVAVDYDPDTVRHSAQEYPDVRHIRGNLGALPIAGVGATVCLQVIEHLWDLPGFLADVRRVTSGWAAFSTPNRLTFSPGLARGQKPTNPFHVEEFDAGQLRELLLDAGFEKVDMFGVVPGARLAARPQIVQEQVTAAITGVWPEELEAFVSSVTSADFEVVAGAGHDIDACLDLVAVAS